MNREEYLRRLLEEIKDFSKEDQEQIAEYFEEMICDRMENGETEEEILQAVGSPEQAGRKLRSEYEYRLETANQQKAQAEASKQKSDAEHAKESAKSQKEEKDLQFIRVQAENTRIHVRSVKTGSVQVLFDPREGIDEVWTSDEDGGFTFNHRMKRFWFFDIWEFGRSKWITVQIPENFHGRLELITKNGGIQAENLGHVEDLHAETTNAKIYVSRTTAETFFLQTTNGAVSATGVEGRDIWIKTSNGHIVMEDAQFSGSVDAKASNAPIEVSGVSGGSITLQSSNGAIRGWLEGSITDYDIESRTSNGGSTLPTTMHSGKGKRLKVRTSNGKINLSFSKDS